MKCCLTLILVLLWAPTGCWSQESPETVFDYDRTAPFDVRIHARTEHNGYVELDLTYQSPAGGRVPALLFLPTTGQAPYPAVIVQHGMPGSRQNAASYAAEYARRGVVSLAITAPWARPDDEPRPNVLTMTAQDAREQIQLIQDLRRAIDLLQARSDVAPDRIAYSGGSYGGAMGGLLAGVENRIVAYALWVGDGGLVAHVTGPEDAGGQLSRLPAQQRDAWLEAMEPIEPMRWVGRAAPAELLFQNGRQDRLVPAADAADYHAAASEPKTILWYDAGHGLNEQAREDRRQWIMERIRPTSPEAMPWLTAMGAVDRRSTIQEIRAEASVTVSDGLTYDALTVYRDPEDALFIREYTDRTVTQSLDDSPSAREVILGHQFHAQLLFFDALHDVEGQPVAGRSQGRQVMVLDGPPWRMYYDGETGLPLGMELVLPDAPPIRFTFDGWLDTDGILLPHVVHIDDGERTFSYQYSNIQLR